MKHILSLCIMALAMTAFAQQKPVELKVWPYGSPYDNELKGPEKDEGMGRVSNISEATMTVYPAKEPNGTAVVICPGGGYFLLAMDHEGTAYADWFNAQGITVAVLKYRMPNGHHEIPGEDALQAIRLLRQHSDEWYIQKVGIMGFSAGGHCASTAATHFTSDSRPDFQILFYPVISFDDAITHQGTKENLIGKNAKAEMTKLYSNELQVTPQTPKAWIACNTDDKAVPVENSIRYYQALVKNGVHATMHVYPTGGHGWGFNDSFKYKSQWTSELEKWLREEVIPLKKF